VTTSVVDAVGALRVVDEGPIRTVTLSHPHKKNALTRAMLAALEAALPREAASHVQPIRVVVLVGDDVGGAFSAGFDLSTVDDDERARGLDPISGPARAIAACPVPVIAAIAGPCMGGALELAVACTLRVSSSSSRFCMPPARLGLMYAAEGLLRFVRLLGEARTQRLFLLAETLDGTHAHALGLVDELAADPRARALQMAQQIAGHAPLAITGLLDGIRRVARPGGPTDDDRTVLAQAHARTLASRDLQEGVRAFAEKRAPVFEGR
jgi:enoyl-CoA hydratase/carnithine racemase